MPISEWGHPLATAATTVVFVRPGLIGRIVACFRFW